MKYSKLTYYLLAVLCITAMSCVTEGVMDDYPNFNGNQAIIKDAHVNFMLTFPSNVSTRGTTNDLDNERKINDVHVYTFQNDRFVEEIEYVVIDGKDGDISRNIDGKLSGEYISGTVMEFVVIINVEKKGINNITLTKGNNKETLYKQLLFDFNKNDDWSEYIPMWGVGTIQNIKEGINQGNLTLKRAIAKVNVTVNDGQGIKDFEITEIQLHNYNTQGYCAPINNNGPSIPTTSSISNDFLTSGKLSGTEGNRFENKFYIPEHKNINEEGKVYLIVKAMVKGTERDYNIAFSKNDADYNVLRNYIYVFNITSVKMDIDFTLEYEVKKWDEETIDIPSFD